jgi:hypothetical protein
MCDGALCARSVVAGQTRDKARRIEVDGVDWRGSAEFPD